MQGTYEYFVDQLINGITLGAVYGLIAIGYTMVYGIIGMINFAHGEIFMLGAFTALISFLLLGLAGITWVPLAILIVLIVAMVLTPVYGWTLERLAYRHSLLNVVEHDVRDVTFGSKERRVGAQIATTDDSDPCHE